jgi:hypothetical protein
MSDNNQKTATEKPADNGHQSVKSVKPKAVQVQHVNDNQVSYSTWMLLVGLIFAFIILKTFIYIKDDKRDGK